ncbi:MAG: rod shape-determining protein MreC [Terriglobales bacterium]
MDLFKRHLNLTVLVAVLFVQVIALAYQIKRPTEGGPVRLIRQWGINLIAPAEHAVVDVQSWIHNTWRNYFYLRDVRRENERLQDELARLRMQQARLLEDTSQAQRLQALLKFKEQFIGETVAAQVIGSSGSDQSRVLYLDKGSNDGVKADMAVIVPAGIVGKIIRVLPNTSQVLLISDQFSGVGAILEKSRLQGILKGTPAGHTMLHYVMADEKVEIGEMVLTSGGDRIFPKGLPIGRVSEVEPGPDSFLNIWVKPSSQLSKVEEVLVITRMQETQPSIVPEAPMRAADILAQRLPTVPPKPPQPTPAAGTTPTATGTEGGGTTGQATTPGATAGTVAKPATTAKPTTTTATAPAKTSAGEAAQTAAGTASNGTGASPTAPRMAGASEAASAPAKPKPTNGVTTHTTATGVKVISDKPVTATKPAEAKPAGKPPAPPNTGAPQ